MLRKLRRRSKEDKGAAVVVLGLMLIIALLLVAGLLLDISKAQQLKSSYIDAARKSTQAAIMKQSTTGHLQPEAAGEAIRVYENVMRDSVVNKDGAFSKCTNYNENHVELVIYFGHDNTSERIGSIKRNRVGKEDSASKIADEMGLLDRRAEIASKKYTSIELVVVEGTQNVVLPTSFKIIRGQNDADKMSCQKMTIGGKANVFTELTGNQGN